MSRRDVLGLIAMFLAGPLVVVAGVIIYELGARDAGQLVATIGWLVGGVFWLWAATLVFWRLPDRYSVRAIIAAIPVAVVGALLHNLIYALTGAEEPVFFLVALGVAPAMLIGGFLGFVLHKLRPVHGDGLHSAS